MGRTGRSLAVWGRRRGGGGGGGRRARLEAEGAEDAQRVVPEHLHPPHGLEHRQRRVAPLRRLRQPGAARPRRADPPADAELRREPTLGRRPEHLLPHGFEVAVARERRAQHAAPQVVEAPEVVDDLEGEGGGGGGGAVPRGERGGVEAGGERGRGERAVGQLLLERGAAGGGGGDGGELRGAADAEQDRVDREVAAQRVLLDGAAAVAERHAVLRVVDLGANRRHQIDDEGRVADGKSDLRRVHRLALRGARERGDHLDLGHRELGVPRRELRHLVDQDTQRDRRRALAQADAQVEVVAVLAEEEVAHVAARQVEPRRLRLVVQQPAVAERREEERERELLARADQRRERARQDLAVADEVGDVDGREQPRLPRLRVRVLDVLHRVENCGGDARHLALQLALQLRNRRARRLAVARQLALDDHARRALPPRARRHERRPPGAVEEAAHRRGDED